MSGLRFFASRLSRRERRIYSGLTIYFCVVFLAMMWPVYPLFSRARPLIAGLPLSLFYLAVLLLLSFGVLAVLYRWESRRGTLDTSDDHGDETEREPSV